MVAFLAPERLGPQRRENIATAQPDLKAQDGIHCEHQLPFSCAVIPRPCTESVFISHFRANAVESRPQATTQTALTDPYLRKDRKQNGPRRSAGVVPAPAVGFP